MFTSPSLTSGLPHLEGSKIGGYPKSWMVYFMEMPIKMSDYCDLMPQNPIEKKLRCFLRSLERFFMVKIK